MQLNKKINNKISLITYLINHGITIPHYCYHTNLSVAGNCWVCLVELKNSIKPVVSCSISASSAFHNNKVYHNSVLVKKAWENILEFLLINHPLDCPICDQGGECDLQDQSLFFGFTKRWFYKFKKITSNKNLGPIIKTVMTRCIHCTRCVRFATEIAGIETLGMFGWGNKSEIGTYVDKIFISELSGNVLDLCPVGALTLKTFPFELWGWDIEKFESFDPTDGFAVKTKVYLHKNQIVQIEPSYWTNIVHNKWLSDRGRHFFDGIFSFQKTIPKALDHKESWLSFSQTIFKTIYVFEHCSLQNNQTYFLTFIFNNLNLETLNMLFLINETYAFIKLRKLESSFLNLNLESNFQLNYQENSFKYDSSNLCLLISSNSRYEGYQLNLSLRQKILKSNFTCLLIGSMIDLTFPTIFLGANINILKSIMSGKNFICQYLKFAKNPLLLYNNKFFQRLDGKNFAKIIYMLNNTNVFSKSWNALNFLNSSLDDTGNFFLNKVETLKVKDLKIFSSLYFLNVTTVNNTSHLEKITELKLIKPINRNSDNLTSYRSVLNLNFNESQTIWKFCHLTNLTYWHLTIASFCSTEESFLNTEGYLRWNPKLFYGKQNHWQILWKFLNKLKTKAHFLNQKKQQTIYYNSTSFYSFRNFINFHFFNTSILTDFCFYSNEKNKKVFFKTFFLSFKLAPQKLFNTKFKFWLNDFYNESPDEYSQESKILTNCSWIVRAQSTHF